MSLLDEFNKLKKKTEDPVLKKLIDLQIQYIEEAELRLEELDGEVSKIKRDIREMQMELARCVHEGDVDEFEERITTLEVSVDKVRRVLKKMAASFNIL